MLAPSRRLPTRSGGWAPNTYTRRCPRAGRALRNARRPPRRHLVPAEPGVLWKDRGSRAQVIAAVDRLATARSRRQKDRQTSTLTNWRSFVSICNDVMSSVAARHARRLRLVAPPSTNRYVGRRRDPLRSRCAETRIRRFTAHFTVKRESSRREANMLSDRDGA
jgi:hypothetical protein